MKYAINAFLLIFLLTPLRGQELTTSSDEQPKLLFTTNLEEALKIAQDEDKMIFIKGHADWCKPCLRMDAVVFSDPQVIDYFSQHFIQLSIDTQNPSQRTTARRLGLHKLPTLLFLSKDGQEIRRKVGYTSAERLLQLARTHDSPSFDMRAHEAAFLKGPTDLESAVLFLKYISSIEDPRLDKMLALFIQRYGSNYTEMTTELLVETTPRTWEDPRYQQLMRDRSTALLFHEKSKVDDVLLQGLMSHIVLDKVPEEKFEGLFDSCFAKDGAQHLAYYEMARNSSCSSPEQIASYLKHSKYYITTYEVDDAKLLFSAAWKYYEHAEKKEDLKLALEWADRSVSLAENAHNLTARGGLLFKLGRRDEGLASINEAARIARSDGAKMNKIHAVMQRYNYDESR